ncbi:hypothetical protein OQJ18_09060 [Fluoribacter dumoffii]|uniref:Uncharacterized protein n=1 Tax=Fluoribacter dumoffii TaxID=463 RepID=A0A377G721_9GAMM|nr:hypothetical protein [Fluoribacter dumoffii]KTC89496.1 hypothetical protein Ldum_0564 [Fluoribacter dumoffii NY 23]MCW8384688.1 hypothetical protein [Fluoribacter dumoffii]MCW8417753.1 hypothetical protein [Fluoribacter dumoffii]MCW8454405.1 hypothetical protein [Fluoribacter dumoffii]MCW8461521.1 hypothetical protein [Fluoribacter dumoffii]
MKIKGGDSNKKFQSTFFKPQVKGNELNKEFRAAEKNRNKFWSGQNNCSNIIESDETLALNAVALMSSYLK